MVSPGLPAWARLRAAFGGEYFSAETGELLRAKLGALVFADAAARRRLNAIMAPYLRWETLRQLYHLCLAGHQFVLLDMPLLYEARVHRWVHKTIVVHW